MESSKIVSNLRAGYGSSSIAGSVTPNLVTEICKLEPGAKKLLITIASLLGLEDDCGAVSPRH